MSPDDALQAWLSQMPRERVRERIEQLENELAFLRRLEAQAARQSNMSHGSLGRLRRRKMSEQRKAIISAIRDQPEGMSPAEIARKLGRELNAIQTAMSRMRSAGQLVRVEQGKYRLPPHVSAARLLAEEDGSMA